MSDTYELYWGYVEEPKKNCDHNWVLYTGLKESFFHCSKCGMKKEQWEKEQGALCT